MSRNEYCQRESRIPTNFNRFTVLQDFTEGRKSEDCNQQKKREVSQKPLLENNNFVFNSFDHFMKNIKYFSPSMYDDKYSVFIKNNKNSLFTGYSLDSFYPIIDSNLQSNVNVQCTNDNLLNSNKVTQIASSKNKYNIAYFKNIKGAYRISKTFYDGKENGRDYNSSSIKLVTNLTKDASNINKTTKQPYKSHNKITETNEKIQGEHTPRIPHYKYLENSNINEKNQGEHTPRLSRISHKNNTQGEHTPRVNQSKYDFSNEVRTIPINNNNIIKTSRNKYYWNNNNNNKKVDKYISNQNHSNNNINNIKIQSQTNPYTTQTHIQTHTYKHTLSDLHTHTHSDIHKHKDILTVTQADRQTLKQSGTHTISQTDRQTHLTQHTQMGLVTDNWNSRNSQFLSRKESRFNIAFKQYPRNLNGEVSLNSNTHHCET